MKQMKVTHKLAAALTAGVMASQAGEAQASNFSNVAGNITTSFSTVPSLISAVGYIGGLAMAISAVFKIKEHVDNPGQVKLKDGLIRLIAGGALLSLPFIVQAMMGTVGTGGTVTQATLPALTP